MSTTSQNRLRTRTPMALAVAVASAMTLSACGSSAAGRARSGKTETAQAPTSSESHVRTPPTTNAQGGFGLPRAEPVTSLGIAGVTEVTFPQTCRIELVALDGAIGFTVGSAAVSPEGQHNLTAIASARLAGTQTVTIVGHTSSEGDPAFNQKLSERRAAAVRAVLEPLVPGAAFSSEGRGPAELVLAPDGSEDRPASRRVVITAQLPETTCSAFGS